MPFNVSDFRSRALPFGGARPTNFNILLSPPATIGNGAATTEKLSLVAQSSQLPPMTLGQIEVPYFGRKIKLQGDRTYPDWTVTIMNDEDFDIRSMFEAWSNKMNAIVSNRSDFGSNPLAYKVDAIVNQYGKAGPNGESGIIRSYKFVGAWPSTISAINLDWSQTNTIETFDVTLTYDWWEPVQFGLGEVYQPTLPENGQRN